MDSQFQLFLMEQFPSRCGAIILFGTWLDGLMPMYPRARLEQKVGESRSVLERLPELGISIDDVTGQLEDEGVKKFDEPFDKLMETLAQRSSPHLAKAS
jgi:hypothetical protein